MLLHEVADDLLSTADAAQILGLSPDMMKSHSPLIIIAGEDRVQAILDQLARVGQDVAQVRSSGRLTVLDAQQTLEDFMVDGMPDPQRFHRCIGDRIERSQKTARGRQRLRVYGEMVDLLCRQRRVAAAVRFEELWNELASGRNLSRLCGYSIANFATGDDSTTFEQVCDLHTRVVPTERYPDQIDPQDRLRKVAVLEQQARALKCELALRRSAEQELRAMRNSESVSQARPCREELSSD